MKRWILLWGLLLGCNGVLTAQKLTLEYNFGYGTFNMQELKDFLSTTSSIESQYGISLKNLKMTDDFPGHWMNQVKVGVEITPVHQVGLSLDLMNTAGQKALSDYSGYYHIRFNTKGIRLGEFYRISPNVWSTTVFRPYLMLTTGVVFNDGKYEEKLELYDLDKASDNLSLEGVNFFIEPAIGCKIRLHDLFALNVNAGYQFDLIKRFDYKGEKANIAPDWSGLRVQGGLIFYVSLR